MIKVRPIELLAPARDLTCGIEAVRHGADAVYIGAPRFGARVAAGNTVDEIRELCRYAHLFGARVYIALNTILKDDELPEVERLIRQLYAAGADALIVQDMGITQLDLPPIELHASTQADNCTPEKVDFLHRVGFAQAVLARELTIDEIRAIAHRTPIRLEAFVHGALCVSYSGRCYLSAALNGRSANRGECSQCCRLPYTMEDADGQTIVAGKHLLSLKDLMRDTELEAMLDAGIWSFKIEGRLKDVTYVKNTVAHYRRQLDAIFERNPRYRRASAGRVVHSFTPQPAKSFNRGFTPYFLHGRIPDIASIDTPKSVGEPVGMVREVKGNSLVLAGSKRINNGDGLVFINDRGELEGFRVNRAEGSRLFPQRMPHVRRQTALFRNSDRAFEEQLAAPSAERRLRVDLLFADTPSGFALTASDETGLRVAIHAPFALEPARNDQTANIRTQLARLGDTPFEAGEIAVRLTAQWFVPSSLLSDMRRRAATRLQQLRLIRHPFATVKRSVYNNDVSYPQAELDYTANVSNRQAETFYRRHGVSGAIAPAFELQPPPSGSVPLMYTKHCLRYSMGWCPVHQGKSGNNYREPFYLVYKQTRLRLAFDCRNCQMLIYRSDEQPAGGR